MHSPSTSSTDKHIPAGVWVLGGVSLLMDISSEMIHCLLPLFLMGTLGATAFTLGVIEGLAESTTLIVKIFSGSLSDYLGKRKTLVALGYSVATLTKPLFAIAPNIGFVFAARLLDRIGKGVREAPRDALIADLTPIQWRGSAYGLRQSLDTVGAVLGPLLSIGLMLLWNNNFRAVFWLAMIPGLASIALLVLGLREPAQAQAKIRTNPISKNNLHRLGSSYWRVVSIGAVFTLARFSEAFLVLRAQQSGIALALVPFVMVAMNIAYAIAAYPFGKLSDKINHHTLLGLGLVVLFGADIVLALENHWLTLFIGVTLWGMHMAMTQGLLATMVAHAAPADLRGTAFGLYNLVSGIALLIASAIAGFVWDKLGPSAPFFFGAAFSALAFLCVIGQTATTD